MSQPVKLSLNSLGYTSDKCHTPIGLSVIPRQKASCGYNFGRKRLFGLDCGRIGDNVKNAWINDLFCVEKPAIAMVHLLVLPGDPYFDRFGGLEKVIE